MEYRVFTTSIAPARFGFDLGGLSCKMLMNDFTKFWTREGRSLRNGCRVVKFFRGVFLKGRNRKVV